MREQLNLSVTNHEDVKNNKIKVLIVSAILIAAAITAVLLVKHFSNSELRANLVSVNDKLDSSKATITYRPDPVFNVNISVDNKNVQVMSSGTVSDALNTADIYVDDDDLINIGLAEKLNNNTSIVINRVEVMKEVSIEVIDYATEYKEDNNLTLGYNQILVNGEEGEIEKEIQHTYIDGELVASHIVRQEITEPVDKVILMGTKESSTNYIEEMSISTLEVPEDFLLDENGVPVSYSNVFTGKSCAYSAKPTAKTASGRQVKVGYVAVDPSIIPYGTELYIATTDNSAVYGYAIAADTGTALLDGRILVDLFMGSYEDSCDWGARQVNIYVLD